eukprot:gene46001-7299_t
MLQWANGRCDEARRRAAQREEAEQRRRVGEAERQRRRAPAACGAHSDGAGASDGGEHAPPALRPGALHAS